jgi:PAS domain S-box-containing protein
MMPSPVLDSIGDAVFIVDSKTRTIAFSNPAVQTVFGYSREEVLGSDTRFLHVGDEEYARFARDFDPVLERHGTFRTEYNLKRRDGTVFPAEITVTELSHEAGWRAGVVSWIRDISERKQAEERLALQEEQIQHGLRMESIGRLSGGVAHDFNNILTIIGGYLHIAMQSLHEDHPARAALDSIGDAGARAAGLTKQLLLFSRKGPSGDYLDIDVNLAITNITKMLRRLIGEDIKLETRLTDTPAWISGDEGKIDQVVMNLVLNARDALPDGGTITVSTALLGDNEPEQVVITVNDNGSGMDAETVTRAFDPFFSTKSRDMGTGLGLSVVYGIVQEHHGRVHVDSAPGKGTTVSVTLPRVEPPLEETTTETAPEVTAHSGVRKVLIVEDEAAVIDVISSGLSRVGYEITAVTSLTGAVRAWQEAEGEFYAIVSDVVLPDGSGVSLLDLLKPLGTTRIVFASGYLDDKKEFEMIRTGNHPFLRKPYTISGLRAVLDGFSDQSPPQETPPPGS